MNLSIVFSKIECDNSGKVKIQRKEIESIFFTLNLLLFVLARMFLEPKTLPNTNLEKKCYFCLWYFSVTIVIHCINNL